MLIKSLVIIVYSLLIIVFGLIGLKRTRTFSDFFLGGGKVGPWMTAFTYGTAYFSAVLFIGFAGKIGWDFGYSGLWIAIGNTFIGVLLVWWLLGPRIKTMADEYGVSTMAEYFEKRYDSRFLKLFSSICIFVFFIPYSAAVFIGLSYLFKTNFDINFSLALIFMGFFTAIYLVLGGYKSMTMIDVIFGIIMIAGVIILVMNTVKSGGGLQSITMRLEQINPSLVSWVGPPGLWPLISLVFLTSVAPMAMPQLVQKFYAIRDRKAIRIGMIASTIFALLICGAAYFTGATTRVFLTVAETPDAFELGKPVVDNLMPILLAKVIPHSLSILILLLILSASMSTLAALVLISSSAAVKDVYQGFINPQATDLQLTLFMRVANACFVLLSVILAYFRPATIVAILGVSWGAIGSVFLGPFIWGLFMKKANKMGAISSAILGLTVCLSLSIYGMSPPEAGTLGMIVSLCSNPIVSLVFQRTKPQTR
ncbi:sodium:solute symporter [bacterium]|nr:sodium:solute symporter [candidate division CSSED10-310 bacterium]